MILTCPNCGTQYVVKDGAIPPQGRQVRCASCKHSWHQDPEAAPFEEDQETLAEATMIDPSSGPEAEERAYEETVIENSAPEASAESEASSEIEDRRDEGFAAAVQSASSTSDPADFQAPPEPEIQAYDEFSPFAERDYVETGARRGFLSILILLIVIAAAAAAFWFFAPPEWKAKVGLADSGQTPLQLMITHPDRQKLASGNELLTVTGRVINPTDKAHPVPPIYAQLKSRTGKVIYSWTIAPPAPTLDPGASASFNSAEVNVPAGGDDLTVTLGSPKA